MADFVGDFSSPAGRFAVVAGRFNALVTDARLVAVPRHPLAAWRTCGVHRRRLGSRLSRNPLVASRLAASGRYAAVICLGCVIRGETAHFDHVAGQAASGVMQASLSTGVPVIFGILTTDTVEQALNRAGLKGGNKGSDAALAAIEMANLMTKLAQ